MNTNCSPEKEKILNNNRELKHFTALTPCNIFMNWDI